VRYPVSQSPRLAGSNPISPYQENQGLNGMTAGKAVPLDCGRGLPANGVCHGKLLSGVRPTGDTGDVR